MKMDATVTPSSMSFYSQRSMITSHIGMYESECIYIVMLSTSAKYVQHTLTFLEQYCNLCELPINVKGN